MSHFCQGSYSRFTKWWFLIFILTSNATDWTGKEMSLTVCERPQSELRLDNLSTGLDRRMHCVTVLWNEKLSELKHPVLLWRFRHLVFCLLQMITYKQQTELTGTHSYSELLVNYNIITWSKIVTWSETCCSVSLSIDKYLDIFEVWVLIYCKRTMSRVVFMVKHWTLKMSDINYWRKLPMIVLLLSKQVTVSNSWENAWKYISDWWVYSSELWKSMGMIVFAELGSYKHFCSDWMSL